MPNQPQFYNFDINDFERIAFSNQTKKAIDMLKSLITLWDSARDIEGWVVEDPIKGTTYYKALHPILRDMPLSKKQLYIQRLASSITAIFSNNDLVIEKDDLIFFLLCKEFFRSLFGCTSYRNMDHILFCRDLLDKDLRLKLRNDDDITWLWLCFTLESNIKIDLKLLFEASPEYSLYGYIGCLYANRVNLTDVSQKWLKHFSDVAEFLPNCEFNSTLLDALSSPWMLCSYFDLDNQHDIKIGLNKFIKNWLDKTLSASIKMSLSKNSKRSGPVKKIAVFSEKYTSDHAMYRCYHSYIESLKEKYHVTLVSRKGDYDEEAKKDFDEVISFTYDSTIKHFGDVINTIAAQNFDVIYYPSLGMSTWAILMCNLRIARYQMMSPGHPASSFSDEIDYMLTMGLDLPGELINSVISEKTLKVGGGESGQHFQHSDLPRFKSETHPKITKPSDGRVRIAINSSIMKVSKNFMNLCKIIETHSTVPLEFHFFPAIKPAFQFQFYSVCLGDYVKNYVVHPPYDYPTYMTELSQCDIALGTFPFGGANSNTDLLILGIPKILRTDFRSLSGYADKISSSMVNGVGFIETKDDASFMANAINLIHNHVARRELSDQMKSISLKEYLNVDDNYESSSYLLEVIRYLESKDMSGVFHEKNDGKALVS